MNIRNLIDELAEKHILTKEELVYIIKNINGNCIHEKASQEWMDEYTKSRMKPLVKK